MSNIVTTISLCDVEFNPTNELIFNSLGEQTNYFNSKVTYTVTNAKYQDRRGTIRIKKYVDDINNANYGFYENSYRGTTKRFYFWIVEKNLIAKDTCELTIQLDVFQTWLFEFQMKNCMIERVHVKNDATGLHTLPEDFELGDYVTINLTTVSQMQGDLCFILALTDIDNNMIGGRYNSIYSGYKLIYFKGSEHTQLTSYITNLVNAGKADAIAFIFSYPDNIIKNKFGANISSGTALYSTIQAIQQTITVGSLSDLFYSADRTSTYLPKNNKMLCYPYQMIRVSANSGNVILKPELFYENNSLSRNNINFDLYCTLGQSAVFSLVPKRYNGQVDAWQDSIEMQGFPLCSWNNDNFANWFANNSAVLSTQSTNALASLNASVNTNQTSYDTALENLMNTAKQGMLDIVGNTLSLNIGGIIQSGASTMYSDLNAKNTLSTDLSNSKLLNMTDYQNTIAMKNASVRDASVQPNTCKGDTTASGLDASRNTNTFFISLQTIKPEYAQIIDSYYTLFGYKVMQIGNPADNFQNRQRFTYIKTVNAIVTGNVPTADRAELERLFNTGLTIWRDKNSLFDYDTTNKPI